MAIAPGLGDNLRRSVED